MIGYTNCLAVPNYSQSLMKDISQLKWYFAHASVGGNMMDGIAALRAASPTLYQLRSSTVDDTTLPTTTLTGMIYDYNRGNPDWQAKVDIFQASVSNGWRFPKVNLAMNKFCFIDSAASLSYYLSSMTNLEAAFPETLFVYATIPLLTSTDDANYARNLFNDTLRDWVCANSRVLYDIADIEAHDSNGVLCTFIYNNRVCQQLCSSYTTDGGHLNSAAGQLVAKGFYAMGAALMLTDRDGDGLSDGQELIAGTRPLDRQSVFKFVGPMTASPGTLVFQWNASSNRFYTLQRGAAFSAPVGFINLLLDAPGTPPMNSYTDSIPKSGAFFYRASVRQ